MTVEGFGEAGVDTGLAAPGSCQSIAELVDLLGRSEQDPPVWGACLLTSGEVSGAEPPAQRAGGATQMGGELGQQPLVVPEGFGRVDGQRVAPVRKGTTVAAQDLRDDAVADRPVSAGGLVSVAVELVGDLLRVPAGLGQLQNALLETGVVAQVLEGLDGAAHKAGGGAASGPVQGEVDQFAHAADADGDLVNDGADDFLAVGVGDAGCLP